MELCFAYAPHAPVAPQAGSLQKKSRVSVFVTIPFLSSSLPTSPMWSFLTPLS
jgi:hypothetical protein